MDGGARLLHIGQEGVEGLPDGPRTDLLANLRRQVARQYPFDVFISHNRGDEAVVEHWSVALAAAGLTVYLDSAFSGERFTGKIQAALLNSLTLLAFVSPHTMARPESSNWVLRELAFREQNFSTPWIIPVVLPGADVDAFGSDIQ